jgi:3,4-dihydroxy 2-butanone 4-phosphate synthase / GTP cyclohydrolase II
LKQPGHISPLMAQPGGVLTRAGHTEAGCDLARLAGLEPASVIVEILNEDGSMARRADLETFAKVHTLKIGTIADLIRYRMEKEKTVQRVAERRVPTEFGEFQLVAYEDRLSKATHLALTAGEIRRGEPTLVRVHLQDTLGDMLGVRWDSLGLPLRKALQRIAKEGGVLIVLRQPEEPGEIMERLSSGGTKTPADEANAQLRTYGVGAQILLDLGVTKMRVLSQPKKMHGISGFGLEVVEYVTPD